jgi:hypothetical protein
VLDRLIQQREAARLQESSRPAGFFERLAGYFRRLFS